MFPAAGRCDEVGADDRQQHAYLGAASGDAGVPDGGLGCEGAALVRDSR